MTEKEKKKVILETLIAVAETINNLEDTRPYASLSDGLMLEIRKRAKEIGVLPENPDPPAWKL